MVLRLVWALSFLYVVSLHRCGYPFANAISSLSRLGRSPPYKRKAPFLCKRENLWRWSHLGICWWDSAKDLVIHVKISAYTALVISTTMGSNSRGSSHCWWSWRLVSLWESGFEGKVSLFEGDAENIHYIYGNPAYNGSQATMRFYRSPQRTTYLSTDECNKENFKKVHFRWAWIWPHLDKVDGNSLL